MRRRPRAWSRRIALILAISATACVQLSTPAGGQGSEPNCSDRASALRHLDNAYGEKPVALGLTSSGGVVELLVSADNATWSLIVTLPTGISCLLAAGEHWQDTRNPEGERS